jgi:hypothetical protein
MVMKERERESNMHKEGGENSRKKRKINNISLSLPYKHPAGPAPPIHLLPSINGCPVSPFIFRRTSSPLSSISWPKHLIRHQNRPSNITNHCDPPFSLHQNTSSPKMNNSGERERIYDGNRLRSPS